MSQQDDQSGISADDRALRSTWTSAESSSQDDPQQKSVLSCRWYIFAIIGTGAGCMVTVAVLMYQEVQKAQWIARSLAIVP